MNSFMGYLVMFLILKRKFYAVLQSAMKFRMHNIYELYIRQSETHVDEFNEKVHFNIKLVIINKIVKQIRATNGTRTLLH